MKCYKKWTITSVASEPLYSVLYFNSISRAHVCMYPRLFLTLSCLNKQINLMTTSCFLLHNLLKQSILNKYTWYNNNEWKEKLLEWRMRDWGVRPNFRLWWSMRPIDLGQFSTYNRRLSRGQGPGPKPLLPPLPPSFLLSGCFTPESRTWPRHQDSRASLAQSSQPYPNPGKTNIAAQLSASIHKIMLKLNEVQR